LSFKLGSSFLLLFITSKYLKKKSETEFQIQSRLLAYKNEIFLSFPYFFYLPKKNQQFFSQSVAHLELGIYKLNLTKQERRVGPGEHVHL
jgi:hypothetical protein